MNPWKITTLALLFIALSLAGCGSGGSSSGGGGGGGGSSSDTTAPTFSGVAFINVAGPNSIEIGWSAASDTTSSSSNITYLIYVSTTSGGQNFNSPSYTTEGGTTFYKVPLLVAGTTYYIVVRAKDEAGNIDTNTTQLSATTLAATAFTWVSTGNLNTARSDHTTTALPDGRVLIAGGFDGTNRLNTSETYSLTTGTFSTQGNLSAIRANHTATPLRNGKVLLAGGTNNGTNMLNTAGLFDPSANTFSSSSNTMQAGRRGHTATLLNTGNVLLAGGTATPSLTSSELYSTSGDSFSNSGTMNTGRSFHTATLLANGKVLVVGGITSGTTRTNTAEIYDPSAGTFSNSTDTLTTARSHHTATLLQSGKVLIAGGTTDGTAGLNTAEIYDPNTDTFTDAANTLNAARFNHGATLLPNGQILFVGGISSGTQLSSAELHDPVAGTFATTGALGTARDGHGLTSLSTGQVLAVGGFDGTNQLNSAQILTPYAGNFAATKNLSDNASTTMSSAREGLGLTMLNNGKILITGGKGSSNPTGQAQTYDVDTGTFTTVTAAMVNARSKHTATLLPDNTVLIAGGNGSSAILNSSELFSPGTSNFTSTTDGSTTTAMQEARTWHTATLLADGNVLVAGGENSTPTSKKTAEIYDTSAGTWAFTTDDGSSNQIEMTTVRSRHTATLLTNKKVLIVGGLGVDNTPRDTLDTAEYYDPTDTNDIKFEVTKDNASTPTQTKLNTGRHSHTATMLPDGKVLILGGSDGTNALNSAEIFDPSDGSFTTVTDTLTTARFQHTATLLPQGKVLITGGTDGTNALISAELYDPVFQTFTDLGNMTSARNLHAAILLLNGKVLVAGGTNGTNQLATAEWFQLGLGQSCTWEPEISTINSSTLTPSLTFGSTVTLAGERFLGTSAGSGGNGTQNSPGNFFTIQFFPAGSSTLGTTTSHYGRFFTITPDSGFSSTAITFDLPSASNNAKGAYLLFVTVNGIPSRGKIIITK